MTRRRPKIRRRRPLRAPVIRPYPEHPVGSNEWIRQQMIRFRNRRSDEEQKQRELRENPHVHDQFKRNKYRN